MKSADISLDKAFNNFYQAYVQAGTPEDNWYFQANRDVQTLADYFGLDFKVAAAVVAVVSPAQRWDQYLLDGTVKYPNLDVAAGIIKLWQDGHDLSAARNSNLAGYPDNKGKAWMILEFQDDIYVSGNKVENFYRNIVNPDGYDDVTIDRWMLRAYLQAPNYPDKQLVGYTDTQYSILSDAVKMVADAFKTRPSAVQAGIWNYTRYQAGENTRGWSPD